MQTQTSSTKTTVIILSDPQSGGEEALGRVFNALAVAHKAQTAGDEVSVVFSGAGARWPAELVKLEHPAHALYQAVRGSVRGASGGCAAVFGATGGVRASGLPLVADYPLPGAPGVASLRRYAVEGWHTLVF